MQTLAEQIKPGRGGRCLDPIPSRRSPNKSGASGSSCRPLLEGSAGRFCAAWLEVHCLIMESGRMGPGSCRANQGRSSPSPFSPGSRSMRAHARTTLDRCHAGWLSARDSDGSGDRQAQRNGSWQPPAGPSYPPRAQPAAQVVIHHACLPWHALVSIWSKPWPKVNESELIQSVCLDHPTSAGHAPGARQRPLPNLKHRGSSLGRRRGQPRRHPPGKPVSETAGRSLRPASR